MTRKYWMVSLALVASILVYSRAIGQTCPNDVTCNALVRSLTTSSSAADPILKINAAHPGVFTNTQQNDLAQALVNGINPSFEWSSLQGGNHATEAMVVGVKVPATSTVFGATGISSYVTSAAPAGEVGGTNAVGGYFSARATGTGANMFGINTVITDNFNTNVSMSNEFDYLVTSKSTIVNGMSVIMGGTATPALSVAYQASTFAPVQYSLGAFYTQDGASPFAGNFGTADFGNNKNSQTIRLRARDAAGVTRPVDLFSTPDGIPIIRTGKNGVPFVVQDYNNGLGGNIAEMYSGLVRFFPTVSGTETMRINSGGNVGIGTSTPTAKLHVVGSFTATGTKSALVETASYGKRQLYAVESPENWFEDFGSARLVEGKAEVELEPMFVETISLSKGYHVFVTPNGACSLYVDKKSEGGFVVRTQNGDRGCGFDYRVVARRRGYDDVRMAAVTEESAAAVATLSDSIGVSTPSRDVVEFPRTRDARAASGLDG